MLKKITHSTPKFQLHFKKPWKLFKIELPGPIPETKGMHANFQKKGQKKGKKLLKTSKQEQNI